MELKDGFEGLGRAVGAVVERPFFAVIEKKIKNFDILVSGIENLKGLPDESFVLVSNHLKPTNEAEESSQLSPDAFVLKYIVEGILNEKLSDNETKRELRIVAKSDDGWWGKSRLVRSWQRVQQQIGKGLVRGMGMIPVMKNPGSVNRDFLAEVEKVVQSGDPILIFPVGSWHEDFSVEQPLKEGASVVSLKHGIPILPVYIRGANSFNVGQKVDLAFGTPILPGEKSKAELTEGIRQSIRELQLAIRAGNTR